MTWKGAVNRLQVLGYMFEVKGDEIICSQPEVERLIEIIKAHKQEILCDADFLIDSVIRRLGMTEGKLKNFSSWLKETKSQDYNHLIELEHRINSYAIKKDIQNLRSALKDYEEMVANAIRCYRETKEVNKT